MCVCVCLYRERTREIYSFDQKAFVKGKKGKSIPGTKNRKQKNPG